MRTPRKVKFAHDNAPRISPGGKVVELFVKRDSRRFLFAETFRRKGGTEQGVGGEISLGENGDSFGVNFEFVGRRRLGDGPGG